MNIRTATITKISLNNCPHGLGLGRAFLDRLAGRRVTGVDAGRGRANPRPRDRGERGGVVSAAVLVRSGLFGPPSFCARYRPTSATSYGLKRSGRLISRDGSCRRPTTSTPGPHDVGAWSWPARQMAARTPERCWGWNLSL